MGRADRHGHAVPDFLSLSISYTLQMREQLVIADGRTNGNLFQKNFDIYTKIKIKL